MKINEFRLADLLSYYEITEQPFEYAGVKGRAELLGRQIIVFRKNDALSEIAALSLIDITTPELIKAANSILAYIDVRVKFGDTADAITEAYGVFDFEDNLHEDEISAFRIIDSKLMIFGISGNILTGLDISSAPDMVEEIIARRRNRENT